MSLVGTAGPSKLWLSTHEVLARGRHRSRSSLYRAIKEKRFPQPVKHSPGSPNVFYLPEVEACERADLEAR